MHTWKLELEYDGTRYRGWQIQHNVKTVQGEMQDAARQLFAGKFEVFGSGRTDAGVHALRQVAHLKVPELKANITPTQIQHGFNDVLPHDINILKVSNAPADFHARHDAVARFYLYRISTRRTAFGKSRAWWIKDKLDVAAMAEAAKLIEGKHDFASFAELEEGKKVSTRVSVRHAELQAVNEMILFRIGASHFLWKMVRRLVGVLVEVGRGNQSVAQFERLLKFHTGAAAQYTAPPAGLYLEDVLYAGDSPRLSSDTVFPNGRIESATF